ncbi:MAG TPA: ribonucleoside-diphosphate reductase, adenosylcobalamin-dependent, partial [Acidilobales archaeon]|nr:ribonucleoside-diphosphate reductase, adenosylcobalamin-dependent [Acidilobales archaeon]
PLLNWEACNLGSINLKVFVKRGIIDWDDLGETVKLAVRFLDDVIDMSWYPDPRIEEAVLRTRKVGLGVMGFADMLAELGIRYDSHDALYIADKVMEYIAYKAREASNELARERGPYPEFENSIHAKGRFNWEPQIPSNAIYDESKVSDYVKNLVKDRPEIDWEYLRREMVKGTRNASVTTIAPTGSIGIIAGVNSSIEPFFALVYVRESTIGLFIEVNRYLKEYLRKLGKLSTETLIQVAKGVLDVIPREYRNILRTAHEISPEWHVRVQAVFQRWVDNAVSKTVNLRYDATLDDVKKVFLLAWKLGCKGVTVFRDRSKPEQVIKFGKDVEDILKSIPKRFVHKDKIYHRWFRIGDKEIMVASEEYAGGCPTCEL